MKNLAYILILIALSITSCGPSPTGQAAINTKAALPSTLNFKQLCPFVIGVYINKHQGSTSILYGNDKGRNTATGTNPQPVNGETLALVTWKQQDDPDWFGGRIPGKPISVEIISTPDSGTASFTYKKFSGKELHPNTDTVNDPSRLQYISALKPSVMP